MCFVREFKTNIFSNNPWTSPSYQDSQIWVASFFGPDQVLDAPASASSSFEKLYQYLLELII